MNAALMLCTEAEACLPARQATNCTCMAPESPSGFLRLFIAIAVPSAMRDEIGRAQGRLKRTTPPGVVRWTRPDQFHVTVKFLGDVPTGQVGKIRETIAPICTESTALQLSTHGIGFFPNERKPRVIWVGVSDTAGQLSELHRQIDESLRWLAPAERPGNFSGHITLGRFKPGHQRSAPKVIGSAAHFRDYEFGEWQARELEVVRSDLTSTGADHCSIARLALAKGIS